MTQRNEHLDVYRHREYNIAVIDFAILRTKHEILNTFARDLRFPAYFRGNRDALDECLRDLHWLCTKNTVIAFRNIAKVRDKELTNMIVQIAREAASAQTDLGSDVVVLIDDPQSTE